MTGTPDLVTVNSGTLRVSTLLNRGDGSFRNGRSYRSGSGSHSLAIGDLNGDNQLDLATANSDPDAVSVFENRGDGSFTERLDYRTGKSPSVAIGDVNGDGRLDIVSANFIEDTA